jgi:glycosyltransferase involved in cell wall biosynthesis
MKNSKHIMLLVPGFPKDEEDFNCIPPLQEFLIKFQQHFPDVEISVIPFQYPFHTNHYKWNSIKVFPLGGKNSKAKKPFLWLDAVHTANRIYKSAGTDVIHSLWLGECAMIGNVLSKRFTCTHICTLMGQDVKKSSKYLRISKNKNTKIIALSKNQSEQFYNLTNRNVDSTIHWGIDNQLFENTERDLDLLAVGSLTPLKNYSLFVNIVAKVKKTFPGIKTVLVGDGPDLTKLKKMVIEKGIETNFEFKGLLNRKDIFKLMQRSKIFVHPSLFEGSGYVFAEALVNGMNIISFNVGYAQKISKWFIADNEADFASITNKLLMSKLDFTPVNLFPIDVTIRKYASLYGMS